MGGPKSCRLTNNPPLDADGAQVRLRSGVLWQSCRCEPLHHARTMRSGRPLASAPARPASMNGELKALLRSASSSQSQELTPLSSAAPRFQLHGGRPRGATQPRPAPLDPFCYSDHLPENLDV